MPPLTPPAWTSLVTGKHPGQHGIFDFFQKEEPGSVYFSFASSQEVRSATIWTLASEQQRRVISLNFPLIFPAPAGRGRGRPGRDDAVAPAAARLPPAGPVRPAARQLPGFNPREMLDMELEIKAIDGCPEDELAELRRAAHPPRAALGRGHALPDGGRTGRPDGGDVRRRRQAPAPLLALHRPRLPARAARRLGAGDDRRCAIATSARSTA